MLCHVSTGTTRTLCSSPAKLKERRIHKSENREYSSGRAASWSRRSLTIGTWCESKAGPWMRRRLRLQRRTNCESPTACFKANRETTGPRYSNGDSWWGIFRVCADECAVEYSTVQARYIPSSTVMRQGVVDITPRNRRHTPNPASPRQRWPLPRGIGFAVDVGYE